MQSSSQFFFKIAKNSGAQRHPVFICTKGPFLRNFWLKKKMTGISHHGALTPKKVQPQSDLREIADYCRLKVNIDQNEGLLY